MIRPGDTVRVGKPLRVREAQRDATARKTWAIVEVDITDEDIEDCRVIVERKP